MINNNTGGIKVLTILPFQEPSQLSQSMLAHDPDTKPHTPQQTTHTHKVSLLDTR